MFPQTELLLIGPDGLIIFKEALIRLCGAGLMYPLAWATQHQTDVLQLSAPPLLHPYISSSVHMVQSAEQLTFKFILAFSVDGKVFSLPPLWCVYAWDCLAGKEKVYGVWRPIWAACRWILNPVCYFPNSTSLQSKMLLNLTSSSKLVRSRVKDSIIWTFKPK